MGNFNFCVVPIKAKCFYSIVLQQGNHATFNTKKVHFYNFTNKLYPQPFMWLH